MRNYILLLLIIQLIYIHSVIIASENENIHDKILSNFMGGSRKELFKVYHFLYNKEYDLNSEEAIQRYQNFKKNLKFIEETNSKNNSFKLGIGPFTDLTKEEFKEKFSSYKKTPSYNTYTSKTFLNEDNLKIDHSKHLNKIRFSNIWFCKKGSWAYDTAELIESNFSLQYGKKFKFSPYELLGCDLGNNACDGGSVNKALDYIKQNGISYQTEYEYAQSDKICKADLVNKNKILESYETCESGKCGREKFVSLLKRGLVSASIDGFNDYFMNYKAGILEFPCTEPNIDVIIFGLDTDVEYGQYYTGRSTWGGLWGEDGHFKIKLNDSNDSCFIEREAILPILNDKITPMKDTCVKAFPECNFKGTPIDICESSTNLKYNKKAVSFKLNAFQSMILFKEPNCNSDTLNINVLSDEKCTMDAFHYNVNSVVLLEENVEPAQNCIWVFEKSCFTGKKVEICSDVPDLAALNLPNKISSIRFGKNVNRIYVYSGANYTGSQSKYFNDYYSLDRETNKGKIKSIKFK